MFTGGSVSNFQTYICFCVFFCALYLMRITFSCPPHTRCGSTSSGHPVHLLPDNVIYLILCLYFFFVPFSFLSAWPCLLFPFFSTPYAVISLLSLIFFQPFYSNRRAKKMMFIALKWTQCFRKEMSIWIHYPKRSAAGESESRRKISKAQQDSLYLIRCNFARIHMVIHWNNKYWIWPLFSYYRRSTQFNVRPPEVGKL